MASNVMSGARTIFKIESKKVMYAQNCTYTKEHNVQPVYVLDQYEPVEFAETSYNFTASCTMFRIPNSSPTSQQIIPKLQDILTNPELTMEIIDKSTGVTILRVSGVKCTGETGNFAANELATLTLNFVGRIASDEGGESASSVSAE